MKSILLGLLLTLLSVSESQANQINSYGIDPLDFIYFDNDYAALSRKKRDVSNSESNYEGSGEPVIDPNTPCYCDNGIRAKNDQCTTPGAHLCIKCDDHHFLDTDNICKPNVCHCANGTPLPFDQCPKNGFSKCLECNENFELSKKGDYCINMDDSINVCVCLNGEPVDNDDCTKNTGAQCKSCRGNYWLHSKSAKCKKNVCYCENGTPVPNKECDENRSFKCGSCHGGYKLNRVTKLCEVEKKCLCPNGQAASGDDCTAHMTNKCVSCNDNFTLDLATNTCTPNICSCTNGVAIKSINCPSDGQEYCAQCYQYYHLDENTNTCQPNVCLCDNGVAAATGSCLKDNENNTIQYCESCNDGYHRDADGACIQNICHCQNGEPKIGTDCLKHNTLDCDPNSCDAGFEYKPSRKSCQKSKDNNDGVNVCRCSAGLGTIGDECPKNGVEKCQEGSCFPGFFFKKNANLCRRNQCRCPNGVEINREQCDSNGAIRCQSCNSGFTLTENKKCFSNACTCNNGRAAAGSDCPGDNFEKCEHCNVGYTMDRDDHCVRKQVWSWTMIDPTTQLISKMDGFKGRVDTGDCIGAVDGESKAKITPCKEEKDHFQFTFANNKIKTDTDMCLTAKNFEFFAFDQIQSSSYSSKIGFESCAEDDTENTLSLWNYDNTEGRIRLYVDPRFCLTRKKDAFLDLQPCHGDGNNQRGFGTRSLIDWPIPQDFDLLDLDNKSIKVGDLCLGQDLSLQGCDSINSVNEYFDVTVDKIINASGQCLAVNDGGFRFPEFGYTYPLEFVNCIEESPYQSFKYDKKSGQLKTNIFGQINQLRKPDEQLSLCVRANDDNSQAVIGACDDVSATIGQENSDFDPNSAYPAFEYQLNTNSDPETNTQFQLEAVSNEISGCVIAFPPSFDVRLDEEGCSKNFENVANGSTTFSLNGNFIEAEFTNKKGKTVNRCLTYTLKKNGNEDVSFERCQYNEKKAKKWHGQAFIYDKATGFIRRALDSTKCLHIAQPRPFIKIGPCETLTPDSSLQPVVFGHQVERLNNIGNFDPDNEGSYKMIDNDQTITVDNDSHLTYFKQKLQHVEDGHEHADRVKYKYKLGSVIVEMPTGSKRCLRSPQLPSLADLEPSNLFYSVVVSSCTKNTDGSAHSKSDYTWKNALIYNRDDGSIRWFGDYRYCLIAMDSGSIKLGLCDAIDYSRMMQLGYLRYVNGVMIDN